MVQEIYIENIANIIRNKYQIEEALELKLENKGKLVFITGNAQNEYLGLHVLEALNLGFSIERALLLKNEDTILQVLNIKNITKRNDLERVRGRIIGTHGKTLGNLKELTDCFIAVRENQIGIIGNTEDIDDAILAVKSLVRGSKQGNVYAKLEKEKKKKKTDPSNQANIRNELKLKHKKRSTTNN